MGCFGVGMSDQPTFDELEERGEALKRYHRLSPLVSKVRSLLDILDDFRKEGNQPQMQRIAKLLEPELRKYLFEEKIDISHPDNLSERAWAAADYITDLLPGWKPQEPQPTPPAPATAPRPSARPEPSRIVSPNPPAEPPEPARVLIVPGSYLRLENIVCVDADGNVFEQYPELEVRTDVFKDEEDNILFFTPYNAARSAEEQGCFNPSFALHCAIIAALYQGRDDPLHAAVLQQYKDRGNGNSGHRPNTLIDWGRQQIIHYPLDGDFPEHGGTIGINTSRNRIIRPFDRVGFKSQLLAEALARSNYRSYIRDLTGLPDPAVLVEVGNYFNRAAKSWVSASNEVRAGWLGASDSDFNLLVDVDLNDADAARGVRLVEPEGGAP